MASIARDPNGRKRILFVAPDGIRKAIRLGKVSLRHAEGVKTRIEHLVAAQTAGCAWDGETARWVAEIADVLADKLAAVGLIPKRAKAAGGTLGAFIDAYTAGRANLKPNTARNYDTTRRHLVKHFGADKPLAEITPGDADQWREWLLRGESDDKKKKPRPRSAATVSREVKRARQFFRAAVRSRLIAENPFADLATPAQVNNERDYFVTREEIDAVMKACPDAQWRLIVGLSRYGGLRCPSETLSLRWGDVDWERERITVRSPKTEHHPGGASRVIPLFPELRADLDAVWDRAAKGTEHVITRYRDTNLNLRTGLLRIIWRAGLKEWPKLFHNMRASRETELTAKYPLHVVCQWIGNSAAIAAKHYLQVTDDHFTQAAKKPQPIDEPHRGGTDSGKAAQNPAQLAHVSDGTEPEAQKETPVIPEEHGGLPYCTDLQIPPRGVEPLSSD